MRREAAHAFRAGRGRAHQRREATGPIGYGKVCRVSVGRTTMDEEALNTSVRKFLRKFGVMAQREIETAVRSTDAKGQLKGSDPLPVKDVVTVGGIDLKFEVDGDIELA
jgi:hypothetical protein